MVALYSINRGILMLYSKTIKYIVLPDSGLFIKLLGVTMCVSNIVKTSISWNNDLESKLGLREPIWKGKIDYCYVIGMSKYSLINNYTPCCQYSL